MNEELVAAYRRLIEAQTRITESRARHGVSDAVLKEAVAACEPEPEGAEREIDVYLAALTRFVAALGGRVEVHAVFPDETVVVPGMDEELRPGD